MTLAGPLSRAFGAAVKTRNWLYDSGRLRARELAGPVVSVGNISVGGSGKTPFTILLGELLQARGIAFDILSRGYGRSTKGVAVVDPNGTSRQFGDEPLLMARRLGVPVVVGEDRYEAGLLAEKTHGVRLHLLDDGFQHRRLKRQFDIVLVMAGDVSDQLLPAGRLRESPAALDRADAVVLSAGSNAPGLSSRARPWHIHRGIAPIDICGRPIAFCGIARPQQFLTQLRNIGVDPAGVELYRDHHAYTDADVRHLLRVRDRAPASGFVTTEKDATNLGPLLAQMEPIAIARVEMTLEEPEVCLDYLLQTLKTRGKTVPVK